MNINLKSKNKKATNPVQKDISTASVDNQKIGGQKRIITENTPFDIIEGYKATRTNIMFSLNSEKGCKKVVISSRPLPRWVPRFSFSMPTSELPVFISILIVPMRKVSPISWQALNSLMTA